MSNLKTILTITAAAVLAVPALAQDDTASILDTSPDTLATDFSAADLDQDEALNADEFVTFAVMRAEAGEETYRDLVLGGDYDEKFTLQDADASGGLTMAELGGETDEAPSDMTDDLPDMEVEPELN